MTNNQLTEEELQTLIIELQQTAYRLNGTNSAYLMSDAIKPLRELQERRKAAMDSEPVAYADPMAFVNFEAGNARREWMWKNPGADLVPLYHHAPPAKVLELAGWQFKSVNGDWLGLIDEHGKNQAVREGCEVREVFAMTDGVNERDQVRREHAEWSQATFGDVGPIGPLKHLSKEALEAAAEPCDLSEWADMQFLLWDAQRRAGITDDQITQAMIEKLAVNKQREWPEPKDGEPRLHIKEQPAPVVPDGWVMVPKEPTERMVIDGFESEPDETFSEPEVWEAYQKMSGCEQAAYRVRLCWAAMLTAAPQEVK